MLPRIAGPLLTATATGRKQRLEREYDLVFSNLLGEKSRKSCVREAFRVFVADELEVLIYPTLNRKKTERLVRVRGWEHLDSGLRQGKGVLLLFAHYGANRMIMPAIGYQGYTMTQLSAPPTVWIEKLPHRFRTPMARKALELRWQNEQSLPVAHSDVFKSLKRAFDCLKRNEVLGIAMDGAGGKRRTTVEFLNKKARFSTGALEIALRTGCAVLPTFISRTASGFHEMDLEPALDLNDCLSTDDPVQHATQAFVHRLEQRALQRPSHYLNFMALRRLTADQGEDDPLFLDP